MGAVSDVTRSHSVYSCGCTIHCTTAASWKGRFIMGGSQQELSSSSLLAIIIIGCRLSRARAETRKYMSD